MRRSLRLALTVFVSLAILPSAAYAQASITGVVRDTSGAVLPGVTVEATSPALIEKVRSVVYDGGGQYRIENLRPGAYVVTFTLPGFATFRREGILAGSTGVGQVVHWGMECRRPRRRAAAVDDRGLKNMLRQPRSVTLDPKNKTVIISGKYLNGVLTYSFPELFETPRARETAARESALAAEERVHTEIRNF